MYTSRNQAPPPDLRIVATSSLRPHEEHDHQRSGPLMKRIEAATAIINPPIVAPMDDGNYVVLDGANRCYVFDHLGYPHILVQVTSYESGYVELGVWQHIVGDWTIDTLLDHTRGIKDVRLTDGYAGDALAHMYLVDGRVYAVHAPVGNTHERNRVLRQFVANYRDNATLHRTAIHDPAEVWPLFPQAIALVVFPEYTPADIVVAAKEMAYLPPGISRHIIHGRALKIQYPLDQLRDKVSSIEEKNTVLQHWVQEKLAHRHVRYYAEATYQFDE